MSEEVKVFYVLCGEEKVWELIVASKVSRFTEVVIVVVGMGEVACAASIGIGGSEKGACSTKGI